VLPRSLQFPLGADEVAGTHLEEQLARVAFPDGEGTLPPPAGPVKPILVVLDHNPQATPELHNPENLVTPKNILNMC
jgi:hypothetical protein